MLASGRPKIVTTKEILTLLGGLKECVRKTDQWDNWVWFEEWTDGKVYRCLEVLEKLVDEEKVAQILAEM